MIKQDRYDRVYLNMAIEWSKLSHCSRKQVGALIVKNGMIISDGYNGTPTGFDNSCENIDGDTNWYVIHAEANAILNTVILVKVVLYTKHILLVEIVLNLYYNLE